MSANFYRRQLEHKRKQRVAAENRAGSFRTAESTKRTQAAKARQMASKTTSDSMKRMRLSEAERREKEAASAGIKASHWQTRATSYAREEANLQTRVTKAELDNERVVERHRQVEARRTKSLFTDRSTELDERIGRAEDAIQHVIDRMRPPKVEKLRILLLGSSSEGDLRIGREQQRIRNAVTAARHRDLVEFDLRPAATASDLLDSATGFRPHVVHFSGHSNTDVIALEDDRDDPHQAVIVTAEAFARALMATDEPPTLVVLNSCKSSAQLNYLTTHVVPYAIGMADKIADGDAIGYAAQFYAAIANGQSIHSSYLAGRSALELAGLKGADLPILSSAVGCDPGQAVLVRPPGEP